MSIDFLYHHHSNIERSGMNSFELIWFGSSLPSRVVNMYSSKQNYLDVGKRRGLVKTMPVEFRSVAEIWEERIPANE
jgi:hypothetical protein